LHHYVWRTCAIVLGLGTLPCASAARAAAPTPAAELTGRAVLPADTFLGEPGAGSALEGPVNGRTPPFPEQPVQGISGMVKLGTDRVYGLSDNGFGTRRNSADVALRWSEFYFDWLTGEAMVVSETRLTDPDRRVPFPIFHEGGERPLTGADFDPESMVRSPDASFWIGDEFGPFLLHVDDAGRLLEPPTEVPVFDAVRPFARGGDVLRSPDHPALADRGEKDAVAAASVRRSGGFESLALDLQNGRLLAMLEAALPDDPIGERRWVFAFSLATRTFTEVAWTYRTEAPEHAVADMAAVGDGTYLVIERDDGEGKDARFKRVYRVNPARPGPNGIAEKTLIADLLALRDEGGLTEPASGTVGLGKTFSLPFITIESLVVMDRQTLLVANDNNYPFSAGRRPGTPDDTEFVRIRLAEPLR
jgi:hypothetical protein